jgi:hypothetical protein
LAPLKSGKFNSPCVPEELSAWSLCLEGVISFDGIDEESIDCESTWAIKWCEIIAKTFS